MAKVYRGFYLGKNCKRVRRLLESTTTLVSALHLSVRLCKKSVRGARKEKKVLQATISGVGPDLAANWLGTMGPSWENI